MTSLKQARPPVKRALKLAPPPPWANLTGLTHVHSTRPKNQVELLTTPGSHAQTGEKSVRRPAAARLARPLTTLSSLIPDSEAVYINTNAVPQPFLDASLLQKET